MAERLRRLFTIPAHRAFADALATGLIAAHPDPLTLARGTVLLPSNRARLAVRDAFVRASGNGLLLPRLVAIGDVGEGTAAALEPLDADDAPVPPAAPPLQRRMALARLIGEESARAGRPVAPGEALRLAGELAGTLEQMLVDEVEPRALRRIDPGEGLTAHWERSIALLTAVLDRWIEERARLGVVDLAERRTRLLDRTAERWRQEPPPGFVCAAGIATAAPAVARLLDVVSLLPHGSVVFAGLDLGMPAAEWDALGPHESDPARDAPPRRPLETHPQFHLKLLLDAIGAARGEVRNWAATAGPDAGAERGLAIANALAPAQFTAKWITLKPRERRVEGVRLATFATPADEAQAIALALRGVLEQPGRTGALVTPDRGLARRVAAHLRRWQIEVDDSAGQPLALLPPGTFLQALAAAATSGFAPRELLTLVKHPLVCAGEGRLDWLEGVRRLDLALRGPRPAPGLAGLDAYLAEGLPRDRAQRRAAAQDWQRMRALLAPLEAVFAERSQPLARLVAVLRDVAQALCGDALWRGPAGRAAAELLGDIEDAAGREPLAFDPADLPALLTDLLGEVAVRPPQGGHPRLAIWGLIEARLQTADLMVLGGLNEGVWPALPAPDPFLPPRIRIELGLPAPDRRIGLAAHDFASALGAPEVLVTRARRDARGPAVASRFWLRLMAMAGDLVEPAADLAAWAAALDRPESFAPAEQPAPVPPPDLRPRAISVTEVDRLKADPYAFYAGRVLGLRQLDGIDADPTPAWRGTAVHAVLEQWFAEDACDPARLRPRALAMLADARTHPLVRALWEPRLMEAVDWLAERLAADRANGRQVIAVERRGAMELAGVTLSGRFDRVDRLAGGGLAIVDYKTGKAPSQKAVAAGYSLQLGLLGAIAEAGGFEAIAGRVDAFEYWSLAKHGERFGGVTSPVEGRNAIAPEDFVALAIREFSDAAANWLTGDAPFTAKLVPEYAPYADYDQLMRRDEWYGRERR